MKWGSKTNLFLSRKRLREKLFMSESQTLIRLFHNFLLNWNLCDPNMIREGKGCKDSCRFPARIKLAYVHIQINGKLSSRSELWIYLNIMFWSCRRRYGNSHSTSRIRLADLAPQKRSENIISTGDLLQMNETETFSVAPPAASKIRPLIK